MIGSDQNASGSTEQKNILALFLVILLLIILGLFKDLKYGFEVSVFSFKKLGKEKILVILSQIHKIYKLRQKKNQSGHWVEDNLIFFRRAYLT